MKLSKIREILQAEVLVGEGLLDSIEVDAGYASDLMSDVLAFASPGVLLLTGLTNIQIFRTAQMLDLQTIIFVRGKMPGEDLLQLAREVEMPILVSAMSMFEAAGRLYTGGLSPRAISRN
ncbi:MAG: transcriptional regulator [Synergistaceae bacterium]|jgi:predicted transcriptional regulator|nr:transcriptional regulator [Synergistaceae bacterium]